MSVIFVFQVDVPEMMLIITASILLILLFELPFQNIRKIVKESKAIG
jgi:hypothetical protein